MSDKSENLSEGEEHKGDGSSCDDHPIKNSKNSNEGGWGGAGNIKIKQLLRYQTKDFTEGKNHKLAGIG